MNPWTEGCLPPLDWRFPAMTLPLSPPPGSGRGGCAPAKSAAFPPVSATGITPSQTAIIGWDSSRGRFYHGYELYMLTASDSKNDLPVFPLFQPASRHDSHGFLHCFFTMKSFLPKYKVSKMWYCRLYATMMLQHLFAWELPFVLALRTALLPAV